MEIRSGGFKEFGSLMKIWGDDFNGDTTVLDGEEKVRFSNQ